MSGNPRSFAWTSPYPAWTRPSLVVLFVRLFVTSRFLPSLARIAANREHTHTLLNIFQSQNVFHFYCFNFDTIYNRHGVISQSLCCNIPTVSIMQWCNYQIMVLISSSYTLAYVWYQSRGY